MISVHWSNNWVQEGVEKDLLFFMSFHSCLEWICCSIELQSNDGNWEHPPAHDIPRQLLGVERSSPWITCHRLQLLFTENQYIFLKNNFNFYSLQSISRDFKWLFSIILSTFIVALFQREFLNLLTQTFQKITHILLFNNKSDILGKYLYKHPCRTNRLSTKHLFETQLIEAME